MADASDHMKNLSAGEIYDAMADKYISSVDAKPHNAYYERPAMLSLLPPLQGLSIFDAGCGSGWYANYFLEQGAARVICIDASNKMIEACRERLGNRVNAFVADLDQPLSFAENAMFDLIVSPLVLHYLSDLKPTFFEFQRVLKPGGKLVFSVHHPTMVFNGHELQDYFTSTWIEEEWSVGKVGFYHHPLEAYCAALETAGFVIERLLEPRPIAGFEKLDPINYETLMRNPGFLCIRARRDR
jgi:SAM-dependent methyltransferase